MIFSPARLLAMALAAAMAAAPPAVARDLPVMPLSRPELYLAAGDDPLLAPLLHDLEAPRFELISARAFAPVGTSHAPQIAALRDALLAADAQVAASVPAIARSMAEWLGATLTDADLTLGRPTAIARADRAVAIERQLTANALIVGAYPDGNITAAATGRAVAMRGLVTEWALLTAMEDQGAGREEDAQEIAELGFFWAQTIITGSVARGATRRLRDPDMVATVDSLTARMSDTQMLRPGPSEPKSEAVANADLAIGVEITILNEADTDFAGLLLPRPMMPAEVATLLSPDEALILTVPTRVGYAVFLVTDTGFHWHLTDRPGYEIDSLAAELLRPLGAWQSRGAVALSGDMPDEAGLFATASAAIYREVLAPLRPHLEGRSRLMVVAGGSLAQFPWAMLLSEAPPPGTGFSQMAWLLRDFTILSLPSPEALQTNVTPAAGPLRYLGIGNPDYAIGRGGWTERSHASPVLGLAPLPETAGEIRAVGALYPEAARLFLLGAEARESALQGLNDSGRLAAFDILHFATHGAIWGDDAEIRQAMLALSTNETAPTPPAQDSEIGSIFNAPVADGALGEREIRQLRLDAALVILSACKTAAGAEYDKDGTTGLAGAFLHAGAERVLASHWPVNSRAAVEIVTSMMRRDPALADPAGALRQAMLEAIERGGARADPAWWAAFSLIGPR